MNSRDAAYDEDEMLRRAIEESRDAGSLGKRTREDSEEYVLATAPQRRALLTTMFQSENKFEKTENVFRFSVTFKSNPFAYPCCIR